MKESTIVKNIMKALGKHFPGFYFKTHGGPFQRAGLPDIIGLHKGRFIGIEVKVPGKEDTLTDIQRHTLTLIKLAGGISFMSTSVDITIQKLQEEFKNDKKISTTRIHLPRIK